MLEDKQIIIDGADVSGCEYWKGYCRIASLCDYPGHLCEVTPNCYYKQLKRKEQECEELKEILNEGCLHNLTLMTEQRVLLQTLAEIKEIITTALEQNTLINLDKILQKINEVEDV